MTELAYNLNEDAPAVELIDTGMKHTPGLYFGMPEDEYHAIPALSASGIRNLMVSPMDFWARSWMNPEREHIETEPMKLGKAFHARIGEGREAFYSRYAREFDKSEYPNALTTAEDIKQALRDLEQKVGGTKAELIERLREADPAAQIMDDIEEHYLGCHNGKVFLKPEFLRQIEISAAMIEKHPDLSRCFRGGYPEVVIIWYDQATGVPMKARMDYLKIQAIVDLKTFSNPLGKPIDRAIYGAMAGGKYHVQAATYLEADKQAIQFARAGVVHGDVDQEWVKKYATVEERRFIFVFQQTGIAPVARGREFPRHMVYECGAISMRDGMRRFSENLKQFGTDPWIDVSAIEPFDDNDFPVYTTEA